MEAQKTRCGRATIRQPMLCSSASSTRLKLNSPKSRRLPRRMSTAFSTKRLRISCQGGRTKSTKNGCNRESLPRWSEHGRLQARCFDGRPAILGQWHAISVLKKLELKVAGDPQAAANAQHHVPLARLCLSSLTNSISRNSFCKDSSQESLLKTATHLQGGNAHKALRAAGAANDTRKHVDELHQWMQQTPTSVSWFSHALTGHCCATSMACTPLQCCSSTSPPSHCAFLIQIGIGPTDSL